MIILLINKLTTNQLLVQTLTLIKLKYNTNVNLSIYGWSYVHKNVSQTIFFLVCVIQFHREIYQRVDLLFCFLARNFET